MPVWKQNTSDCPFDFFWDEHLWTGSDAARSSISELVKNTPRLILYMPCTMRHIYFGLQNGWGSICVVKSNQSPTYTIVLSFLVLDYVARRVSFVCLTDVVADCANGSHNVFILQDRGCQRSSKQWQRPCYTFRWWPSTLSLCYLIHIDYYLSSHFNRDSVWLV